MKSQNSIAGVIALSGLSATSLYAAQPPNAGSVLSDGFYNTAMGPAALSHDTTPTKACSPYAFSPDKTVNTTYYMSGCANTASGFGALDLNTTGAGNTATGAGALFADTSGAYNTAVGMLALFSTSTGSSNAAFGDGALFSNTTGSYNLASGGYSLFSNTIGSRNAASGQAALFSNTAGNFNTADGFWALVANTSGTNNSAAGAYALYNNIDGNGNVAVGRDSLYLNYSSVSGTSSSYNVAVGMYALYNNTTNAAAGNNTAVGYQALYSNTGIGNTALGTVAGNALTTGSYNTDIGYGVTGVAGDNYVTRIGVTTIDSSVPGTPTTYIAGIYGNILSGQPVVVTSSGQLGVAAPSSERYKTDVATMGANTDKLAQLRPVTFRYRSDTQGTLRYGLIAEEVDRVYPELVIHDANGRVDGVRYDELTPMLLNEMQKEQAAIAALVQQHDADTAIRQAQDARIGSLEQQLARVNDLEQRLDAALRELKAHDELVAQR